MTSIGDFTFDRCASLKNIEIPDSVTSIGGYAFRWCTSLMNIKIPDSVTSFGQYAFYECKNLKSVKYNYKAFALTKRGRMFAKVNPSLRFNINRKTKYIDNDLQICEVGIHYCENIFDIFTYYYGEYGKDFVITICDVSENNIGDTKDSKKCTEWVIPRKILTREEVIKIMNGGNIE